jgi:hypothetical protein
MRPRELYGSVDGRTAAARRFRNLVEEIKALHPQLEVGDLTLIRQAAALSVRSEQLQAALLRGEAVDSAELTAVTAAATHALAAIRQPEPHA